MLIRFHHVLADGTAALLLLGTLFDSAPVTSAPEIPGSAGRCGSPEPGSRRNPPTENRLESRSRYRLAPPVAVRVTRAPWARSRSARKATERAPADHVDPAEIPGSHLPSAWLTRSGSPHRHGKPPALDHRASPMPAASRHRGDPGCTVPPNSCRRPDPTPPWSLARNPIQTLDLGGLAAANRAGNDAAEQKQGPATRRSLARERLGGRKTLHGSVSPGQAAGTASPAAVGGTPSATQMALPSRRCTRFCVRKKSMTWEAPYGIEP